MPEIVRESAPAVESKPDSLNALAIAKLLKEDKPESAGGLDWQMTAVLAAGTLIAGHNPKAVAGAAGQLVREGGVTARSRVLGVFNSIAPESLRKEIAQGSPLFNKERALDFRAGIDKLFPHMERRLLRSREEIARAKQIDTSALAPDAEHQRNLYSAVSANDSLTREAEEAVKTSMRKVARDLHFPAPGFAFSETLKSRGRYFRGENVALINPLRTKIEGEVAVTGYHELGHGEQAYLTTRKVADDLGLGKTASPEQMQQFFRAWVVGMGVEGRLSTPTLLDRSWRKATEQYLTESLAMRDGVRLNPAQELRASKLLDSFSRRDQGIVSKHAENYLSANPLSPADADYLKYRSRYVEVEAHMLGPLVLRPRPRNRFGY